MYYLSAYSLWIFYCLIEIQWNIYAKKKYMVTIIFNKLFNFIVLNLTGIFNFKLYTLVRMYVIYVYEILNYIWVSMYISIWVHLWKVQNWIWVVWWWKLQVRYVHVWNPDHCEWMQFITFIQYMMFIYINNMVYMLCVLYEFYGNPWSRRRYIIFYFYKMHDYSNWCWHVAFMPFWIVSIHHV